MKHPRTLPRAFRSAALALFVMMSVSCKRSDEPRPTSTGDAGDPALERAKLAAQALSGALRSALQSAMGDGGPTAAVDVCYSKAPAIAEEVMRTHGVRIGRVAAPGRNRNTTQAAAGWQLTALERMQAAVAGGARAEDQVFVQRENLPDDVALRMMRGIATEGICVSCHGPTLAEPIRAEIARHYPDDHATGFNVGDLRGALWVEVPR